MSDINAILLIAGFVVIVIYSFMSRSDSDDDNEDCENS